MENKAPSSSKFSMRNIVIFAAVLILIIVSVIILNSSQSSQSNTKNDPAFTSQEQNSKSGGIYTAYDSKFFKNAENGNVVLFFHAPWCPTCNAAEKSIVDNKSSMPDNLTILRIDYDTSIPLRKEYGVTMQSTWVKVDKSGKKIKSTINLTQFEQITDFAGSV